MIDTRELFKCAGKSEQSIIETDLDSIRATVFGKFYEGIIAKWLEEKEGYIHCRPGKPCVYWGDIKPLINESNDTFIHSLNESFEKLDKRKIRANLDGLFEKDGGYYLWEAKNWAKWCQDKQKEHVENHLSKESPWLLAKKAFRSTK